jgi:hypothetical protein
MPRKRKPSSKKRLQRVSVRAELRDPVDWDRYAWALLQYARLLSADKEAKTKGKKPKRKPQP